MKIFDGLPDTLIENICDHLSDQDFLNLCEAINGDAGTSPYDAILECMRNYAYKVEWIDTNLQRLLPRNLEEAEFSRLLKVIRYHQRVQKSCTTFLPKRPYSNIKTITFLVVLTPSTKNCFLDTIFTLRDENGFKFYELQNKIQTFDEINVSLFSFQCRFHIFVEEPIIDEIEGYDGIIYEINYNQLVNYWLQPSSWRRPDKLNKNSKVPTLLFLDNEVHKEASKLSHFQGRNFSLLRNAFKLMLDISVRDEPPSAFPNGNCRLWVLRRQRVGYYNLLDAIHFLLVRICQLKHF